MSERKIGITLQVYNHSHPRRRRRKGEREVTRSNRNDNINQSEKKGILTVWVKRCKDTVSKLEH